MAFKLLDHCLESLRDISLPNTQLLTVTCLFMSAKYEEIFPESMNKFLDYTLNSYRR